MRSCLLISVLVASLGLSGCVTPVPPNKIAWLSDSKLYEQMRWVNRGRDSAEFGPGGRAGYIEEVRNEILRRNTDWPADVVEQIRLEQPALGMTMPQVVAAIGWPREYPFWEARRRPLGVAADDYDYWIALQRANQWTYPIKDAGRGGYLRVWFRDGRAYRIMNSATGEIQGEE